MKKQIHIAIGLLSLLCWQNVAAQLVNDGAKIAIGQKALVYVTKDVKYKGGEILHNGTLIVGGNWINENNSKTVFNKNSLGTVNFTGSAADFSGIGTTVFPKLAFLGNGLFKMQTDIGAFISIDLGDSELQTNDNELTLFNTDVAAIQFNDGFVNTGAEGLFIRYLSDNLNYIYPLGSRKLALKRFVSIKPAQTSPQTIGAAFVDTDPNLAGFERSQKANTVAEINKDFYHVVKRVSGTADIDALFHTTATEKYTGLINWTIKNVWERALPSTLQNSAVVSPGLDKSFSHSLLNLPLGTGVPFAFANTTSVSPLVLFNAFSPDGDGKNDTWKVKNIDAYPDNDLKIFDRSGNLVFRANGYNSSEFWDGKNVDSGTYIYVLRVKIDGKDEYFKGAITMVKN